VGLFEWVCRDHRAPYTGPVKEKAPGASLTVGSEGLVLNHGQRTTGRVPGWLYGLRRQSVDPLG
jgi:hypothetical protein